MRRAYILILVTVLITPHALSAGTNRDVTLSFGEIRYIENRDLSAMPVVIHNAKNLRAYTLVFRYSGDFAGVTFAPSTFLFEPLTIQPRLKEGSNTFSVSVTSTKNVLPEVEDGIIGELRLDTVSPSFTIEVIEAQLVDKEFDLDIVTFDGDRSEDSKFETDSQERSKISETRIYQTYPNPANPSTTITFSIRETCHVTLAIFNVNGQLVRQLLHRQFDSGAYDITWDGKDGNGNKAASGIYFCKFRAGEYSDCIKIILLQ